MATIEELTGSGRGSLSEILEFNHVVRINAAGHVSDADNAAYAPECFNPDANGTEVDGWHLITSGLTGQYGYSGPWLHDSEVIAGGVARHILEHAADNGGGLYVSVYAAYSGDDDDEPTIEGWAIAYRKEV